MLDIIALDLVTLTLGLVGIVAGIAHVRTAGRQPPNLVFKFRHLFEARRSEQRSQKQQRVEGIFGIVSGAAMLSLYTFLRLRFG